MSGGPHHLRTQLSLSMILTAVTALAIFIIGMLAFYFYVEQTWMDALPEENKQTLIALLKGDEINPDALTTLVGVFSLTWADGYASKELGFLLLFVSLAVLCSIAIGIVVSKRISRPIEAVTDAALRVADGHMDFQVDSDPYASIEARNLLRTFNQMTQSLQQAEREMTDSAAAIAHELRTPLTVLRGRLQGLGDGAFQPTPEMLEALIGQVDTLARIVDDLGTLSRMTAGRDAPETQAVDLAKEARTVITSLAPDLEKDGIRIEYALEPAIAEADPARIRQALNALLQNAQRYAGSGKYVRVETCQEGKDACLRVIDHGPGIVEADRERIFDRWWRAESSRTRSEGGSGLGLAVVRAIARAHGGEAEVSSNATGPGAVFSLRLPASSQ
ncbi:MAG: HAMP domain-containing histidine kinase [Alphaproteobacteria bacterium]|nr:HAMP domain-containing histidine kinase [Alphaproteobacteria bacterium]